MNIWKDLKYFRRSENWGDPGKVDPKLLVLLDAYRGELGIPLYVSSCVRWDNEHSAHFPNALGYAEAVDVFPILSESIGITLCDCFLKATLFPFSGLGIYPYWKLSRKRVQGNVVETGGLHLDVSTRRRLPGLRSSGQWIGLPGKDGEKEYRGVSLWEFRKHGLV